MWWWRRRSTPLWVWVLAVLGLKSMWTWSQRADNPGWQDKRRRFKSKLDEAFDVWREDAGSPRPAGEDDQA